MSKISLALALTAILTFIVSPVVFGDDIFENTDLGILVQAHELIKLGDNHSVGAEISITDMTTDWNDGSQAYLVYSYTGTLFGK